MYKYITEHRIEELHNSIGYLDTIVPVADVDFLVGNSTNIIDRNFTKTAILNEIAVLNERRLELIKRILK